MGLFSHAQHILHHRISASAGTGWVRRSHRSALGLPALALLIGLSVPGTMQAQSPLEHPAHRDGAQAERGSAPIAAWRMQRDHSVPKNSVYLEFGGASGDRMSLNYERAVWREKRFAFLARAGMFYYQPKTVEVAAQTPSGPLHAGDLILGLHTVYGGHSRHRLETGLNLNLRWTRENGITRYGTQNLTSAQIGYRLLPRTGKGFMFRANAMLVHEPPYNWVHFALVGEKIPARVLPWAGISIGYAF